MLAASVFASVQALLAELSAMRQADPSSKALVFSQYNSTLEWLKRRLPEEGFSFRTITGSMAQRQRARAIEVGGPNDSCWYEVKPAHWWGWFRRSVVSMQFVHLKCTTVIVRY